MPAMMERARQAGSSIEKDALRIRSRGCLVEISWGRLRCWKPDNVDVERQMMKVGRIRLVQSAHDGFLGGKPAAFHKVL